MRKTKPCFAYLFGFLFLLSSLTACSNTNDESKKIKAVEATEASKTLPLPDSQKPGLSSPVPGTTNTPAAAPTQGNPPASPSTVIAQIDGTKFTQGQLDAELKKIMSAMSGKIPPDRLVEATVKIKRQIVDDFIVRTILGNEVNRLKIEATDKEINDAINDMRRTLPDGATMEEMMKKNDLTPDKMRSEVALGLRINKLVAMQPAGKVKPTDKEITSFYKDNPDKFKMPESVQARHILVAKTKDADETAKVKQKTKAEDLRKQLLIGADFGELAKANSDCPSKADGGNLGSFSKGQMVKPFEDAAFGQKKNEIGSVVETDFGYHIIQVLEHNPPKTQALDKNTKTQITAYLQQQKRQEAFKALLTSLKSKANITVEGKVD